jgi:hypothetical protein
MRYSLVHCLSLITGWLRGVVALPLPLLMLNMVPWRDVLLFPVVMMVPAGCGMRLWRRLAVGWCSSASTNAMLLMLLYSCVFVTLFIVIYYVMVLYEVLL